MARAFLISVAIIAVAAFAALAVGGFVFLRGWTTTVQSIEVAEDVTARVRHRNEGIFSFLDEGSQGYLFIEVKMPGRALVSGTVCDLGPHWWFESFDFGRLRFEGLDLVVVTDSRDPDEVMAAFSMDGAFILPAASPDSERDNLLKRVQDVVRSASVLKEKAAQPGATDNPDGAQRLREDH